MKNLSFMSALILLALISTACGRSTHTAATKYKAMNTSANPSKAAPGTPLSDPLASDEMSFSSVNTSKVTTDDARETILTDLENANDPSAKLDYASQYLASMSYQFWAPSTQTTKDRDNMKTIAVKDFFREVKELATDHTIVGPNAADLAKSTLSPNLQKLYSLAATLQYVNVAQTSLIAGTSEKTVTMLSMIEDGLKAKGAFATGLDETQIPAYELEVLRNEQDANYILEVRENYLKFIALMLSASAANGDDFTHNTALTASVASIKTPPAKNWTANYDSRNMTQFNFIAVVLEYAIESQTFLKSLAITPSDDSDISGALSLMTVNAPTDNDPAKIAALNRVASDLKTVLAK